MQGEGTISESISFFLCSKYSLVRSSSKKYTYFTIFKRSFMIYDTLFDSILFIWLAFTPPPVYLILIMLH